MIRTPEQLEAEARKWIREQIDEDVELVPGKVADLTALFARIQQDAVDEAGREDRAEIERLRAEVISWTASAGEQRSRAAAAELVVSQHERDLAIFDEKLKAAEAKVKELEARLAALRDEPEEKA